MSSRAPTTDNLKFVSRGNRSAGRLVAAFIGGTDTATDFEPLMGDTQDGTIPSPTHPAPSRVAP